MSFATDFEIGFSTKQALKDKRKLEQALDSLGRKAEQTGKRMDRALGRGVAQSTRNLKGVAKSIDKATASTKRMERNLRAATQQSKQLAIQQRAVTATTRTGATQAIALGGARAGAGTAAAATATNARAATAAAAANRTLGASFAGVAAGATAARSAIVPLTIGLTALLGGAGLGAAAKTAVRFADEIGKTAGKLGVTTDALQEFRFAAGQSGVNANTATMALQRFTRRAAEAAKGTGEAKEAFATMGIQLTDTNGNLRDSNELLGDVAEAITNTESAGERLRLAFKLFDSEGVALVNVLTQGRAGFEQLTQKARDMGLVLETRLIKNSEHLANQFDIASGVIKLEFTRALVNVAPLILSVAEHVGFLAAGVRRLVDDFRELESQSLRTIKEDVSGLDAEIEILVNNLIKFEEFRDKGFGGTIGKFFFTSQVEGLNEALDVAIDKKKKLEAEIARRAPPKVVAPDPTGSTGGLSAADAQTEATRIEALIEGLTRQRIEAERSVTTATLEEAAKRRAAIGFEFVDAMAEAKGNAKAIAAAQAAFVHKTAALNAELANKKVRVEKNAADDIVALINKQAKANEQFALATFEVNEQIDAGTISVERGALALDQYAASLGLIDERAAAATERLEGMGKALTSDVLGNVSEALVDFDFSTLTDALFAANRKLLVGFVQEGIRPVIGKAFEGLSEASGPTSAIGKVFGGAAEEAFGGTGVTQGEEKIIDAIKEQTRVLKGERTGVRPASAGVMGGRGGRGTSVSTGAGGGMVINCVCECECCCDQNGMGMGQGRSRGAIEAIHEQTEKETFFNNRREAQVEMVDNTVWDSGEDTQGAIKELQTANAGWFSSLLTSSKQLVQSLPGLFTGLMQGIVGGLSGGGPSTTDQVLGIVSAVAQTGASVSAIGSRGGAPSVSDAGGNGWVIETGAAKRGGVVGRTRFPSMQRGGIVGESIPILAHRGELITPLEGGTLPVNMRNGVPEVRTPGGDRVPVDIRGERDVAPVVFAAGAIVIMAQPGERLDATVGQSVQAAFTAGARQQRRNTGRAA